MKKRILLPIFLSFTLLPANLLLAQESFDISDTFETGSPGMAVPLEGTATAAGGASWTATKNVQIKKDDTASFVTTADTRVYCASVPLPSPKGTVTVEGTVNPVPGTDRSNWAAIGLGAPNGSFTWEQGLFLLVDSAGSYEAAVNVPGKGHSRLQRGKIPDLEEGSPVRLSFEYDPASGTVNASVNGVPVMMGKVLEDAQKPRLDCAGFSGFSQKPGSLVINQFRASGTK